MTLSLSKVEAGERDLTHHHTPLSLGVSLHDTVLCCSTSGGQTTPNNRIVCINSWEGLGECFLPLSLSLVSINLHIYPYIYLSLISMPTCVCVCVCPPPCSWKVWSQPVSLHHHRTVSLNPTRMSVTRQGHCTTRQKHTRLMCCVVIAGWTCSKNKSVSFLRPSLVGELIAYQ